ncbi:MAG: UDP-N-acetylglucosamine 2-epimerase [Terracidiphilus sp.]
MPITLAALTVARSDFGRMEALYQALNTSGRYRLSLAAGAGHHDPGLGRTLIDVERSGLPLDYILPVVDGDNAEQSAAVLGGVAKWLEQRRPDALMLLGDRFEMLSAAQAATLTRVPVIHIGGGHLTLGAIDERVRHALSKLSALHLVASKACADRVAALHEDPATIFITGAPELDVLVGATVMSREAFCAEVGLEAARSFLLVTIHPETNISKQGNEWFAREAACALFSLPQQILITAPCADPGNEPFLALCKDLPRRRNDCRYIPNLGLRKYVAALHHAVAMLGNSSSGIIEAASAGLPVVNIGERQAMRDRANNVIDCAFDSAAIVQAVAAATDQTFVQQSRTVVNPYGDGKFVEKAIEIFDQLNWPLRVSKPWCISQATAHFRS